MSLRKRSFFCGFMYLKGTASEQDTNYEFHSRNIHVLVSIFKVTEFPH